MLFLFFNKIMEHDKNKTQIVTNICGYQVTNLLEIISIIEKYLNEKIK